MSAPLIALLLACSGAGSDALSPHLEAPVQVHIDGAGISHVQAASERDAYFAQGYLSARDRMFQMDLLRRRAWGTRAEVLGEDYFDSDLQSRALRFPDWGVATAAAVQTEDPELYEVMVAYTQGVNAFLFDARTGRNGASLAPQFAALDYEPAAWTVEDSFVVEKLIAAGLAMRPDQDIILGMLDLLLGPELFSDFYWFTGFDRAYVVPDFYTDLEAQGVDLSVARGSGTPRPSRRPDLGLTDAQAVEVMQSVRKWSIDMGGSNNQAVAAANSATGNALFASDSHQGLGHPAVYWLVHLQGGELDVLGASFPGVPLVLFGTNGDIAWGPTTSIYDAADVWLEVYADNDDDAVLFMGEEVPIQDEVQEIRVRAEGGSVAAAEPREVTLRTVPHHGPMIPPEALGLPVPLAISIDWNGYQARSIGRTFLDLGRARDVDQAYDALGSYFTGGMHFLFADSTGRIGYDSTSDLPVREVIDPDTPPITLLPGDGGYEWLPAPADQASPAPFRTVPRALIPHVLDPPSGVLYSSNNDPVGQTDDNAPFDAPVYLSGIFDIGTRAEQSRILFDEILATRKITFDDMVDVQLDTTTRLGAKLVPFILQAADNRPDLVEGDVARAVALLTDWDLRCEVDQVEPTLFHAWLAVFAREVMADESSLVADLVFVDMDSKLGLPVSKFLLRWLQETDADIAAIEAGEVPFPSASGRNFFDDRDTDELETRDALILQSLAQAIDELRPVMDALGADPDDLDSWTWGTIHTIELVDPGMDAASSAILPKPGALYTMDVADFAWLQDGVVPDRFVTDNAPSNRFVFELAPEGPTAWMTLPGGQSERPDSPFHNSLLEPFTHGEYAVVPFAADDIEAAAVESFVLSPGAGGTVRVD